MFRPQGPAQSRPPSAGAKAGGSAQHEYERRVARRERRIRQSHPILGGVILALSDEPQSTTAWAQGAAGERRVGELLDGLADEGVVALHDRRIPGTKANIDHIAVTASGVWVIDAKRYEGLVAKKDVGGWFYTDERLFIGRRDCSKLIEGMARQVNVVRGALGVPWAQLPGPPAVVLRRRRMGLVRQAVHPRWGHGGLAQGDRRDAPPTRHAQPRPGPAGRQPPGVTAPPSHVAHPQTKGRYSGNPSHRPISPTCGAAATDGSSGPQVRGSRTTGRSD